MYPGRAKLNIAAPKIIMYHHCFENAALGVGLCRLAPPSQAYKHRLAECGKIYII